MKREDVKLGVLFKTDISFFDNADKETRFQIWDGAKIVNNNIACEIIDIHESLYDTSYFVVFIPYKFGVGGIKVVVPFGNDISKCELLLTQKDMKEINKRAVAHLEAAVVEDKEGGTDK